jgi:hypothetical protein
MDQSESVTLPVFRRSATLKSSRYWSRLILCYEQGSVCVLDPETAWPEIGRAVRGVELT